MKNFMERVALMGGRVVRETARRNISNVISPKEERKRTASILRTLRNIK